MTLFPIKFFFTLLLLTCLMESFAQQEKSSTGDTTPSSQNIISLRTLTVLAKAKQNFGQTHLKAIEGTAIFSGKKSELVRLNEMVANLATNQARQIYAQVVGLNINENNDGGLQLNIGGRGLPPNRTAHFNTRQNGYDISADALGYPESYYTPPAEGLQKIQIVRGAASLQYGTQFGGMLNFITKEPSRSKPIEWVSRQSYSTQRIFTSFNSLSGTINKWSYYTYCNYKKGNGFRPNSAMNSINLFVQANYQFSKQTKLSLDITYFQYLAQQAGGLTDKQFYNDPYFSNRTRNWFAVQWLLYSIQFHHSFWGQTQWSTNLFGLRASRQAVGFRSPRVSQEDDLTSPRDLLIGHFLNGGVETRLLHPYLLGDRQATALIGIKYYQSMNRSQQGAGSNRKGPDFKLKNQTFPTYPSQSDFRYPNLNLALFGEHIFPIGSQFVITPGFRIEYIKTESKGTYRSITQDLAGNILTDQIKGDNRLIDRYLFLMGVGVSWKPKKQVEIYTNITRNYRSITFSDLHINNPSFQISPDITDEKGGTADIGIRGSVDKKLSFDISGFSTLYNNRIGESIKQNKLGRIVRERGNIGSALTYGAELLIDWNLLHTFAWYGHELQLNIFANAAYTDSRYLSSGISDIAGNKVEFVPRWNVKSGITGGYKQLKASLQYTYLSSQYTDASNAPQDKEDNQGGIIGAIPAYAVADLSLSYQFKWMTLETGATNLLNSSYFSKRSTGYPGPGILPAAPRTLYFLLQITI